MEEQTSIEAAIHSGVTFFNYPNWGLAEKSSSPTVKLMRPVSMQETEQAVLVLKQFVNLDGFELRKAGMAEHYQGNAIDPAKVLFVRFERADNQNSGLGGEHISATVDLTSNRLMGFTRMQATLTGDHSVSHQVALDRAVDFLKVAAPDLVPEKSVSIDVGSQKVSSKMDFSPELNIGNLEVHWIGDHKEDIKASGDDVEVHGMKVKTYIPSNQLWAWVVVDKQGQIETFERNIFWNFNEFKRETQMWLHDKWLDAQQIVLPEPAGTSLRAKINL